MIPYRTRFSSEYYRDKARRIRKEINFETAMFLTLTIDPKEFNSLNQAYRAIRKAWHKLANTIAKDQQRGVGHVRAWDGRYLLAVEFQQSGSPHLHIVLAGCRWLDADWVRENWHVGTFVRTDFIHDNRAKVVHYITKYMTKATDGAELPLRHVALLWALNAKAFSTSRRIFNSVLEQMRQNREIEWFYLGSWPLSDCQNWSTRGDVLTYLGG